MTKRDAPAPCTSAQVQLGPARSTNTHYRNAQDGKSRCCKCGVAKKQGAVNKAAHEAPALLNHTAKTRNVAEKNDAVKCI